MNKKFISVVCIILVVIMLFGLVASAITVLTASAVTQAEIDALQEKRDAISSQQQDINAQLGSLQTEMSSVVEQKQLLDTQVELTRNDIELINSQIQLYDGLIADEERVVAEAQERVEKQYERYCERLRSMEENGNNGYISFVFNATSFSDLLTRVYDVMDIAGHDQQLEKEYIAAKEYAEGVLADYQKIYEEQQAKHAELKEKETTLQEQVDASSQMILDLQKDITAYTAYLEEVAADKQAVEDEIAELTRKMAEEEEARRQAAAAAAAAAQAAQQAQNSYQAPATHISNGYFIWPTTSDYITSYFGNRNSPGGIGSTNHKGLDIGAGFGSPIYAAAAGTVGIANSTDNWGGGFGYYVTIYHANGTSTVYAHQSQVIVTAGQTVSQGQIIGYVGSTGASTGPHLHFGVMVGGVYVDPLQYFS